MQLTIISPLQGKREALGIKLEEVLRERMKSEHWDINETPEQIAHSYTSCKENKIDLHRSRLRIQLFKTVVSLHPNMRTTYHFVEEDVSREILDDRHQSQNLPELECMEHPKCCCAQGKLLENKVSLYFTDYFIFNQRQFM